MNARQLHRGTMTIGGLLIAYWVISGLIIAIFDATDPHQSWASMGSGPGARLNDEAAGARSVPSPAAIASGIGNALTVAATRGLPIASVDYRMVGDTPRLQLSAADGSRDTELRFYAKTGEMMTPFVADSNPSPVDLSFAGRRERIKSFHKGDAFGLPGQILGLLAGVILTVMVLSGLTLYLLLWKARRKAGHSALFWKSRESRWRRLHRYVSIVAAIFLLNKAITGTILGWGEIQVQLALHHMLPFPYPRPTPMPPFSEGRIEGDLLRGLQTSYDAARAAIPGAAIVAIELVRRDDKAKGLVTIGGGPPKTLAFDILTGTPVYDSARRGVQIGNAYFADWHQILKRMHRGDIIGRFAGRYGDIACGLALFYLVSSGFFLFVQMRRIRAQNGQAGLFWR
jgi:uncharacterized iron-regulated membrane protein